MPGNVDKLQQVKRRDARHAKSVKRRYPSDQGEYATERPQERADPTTTRNRAKPV